jgi:hypothetical protein
MLLRMDRVLAGQDGHFVRTSDWWVVGMIERWFSSMWRRNPSLAFPTRLVEINKNVCVDEV